MQHPIIKLALSTTALVVLSGCSNYQVRTSDPNSAFCTLAGAAIGGGSTALASAGGPVVAGAVMLGATVGNYICSSAGRPVTPAVAAPAPTPAQKPAEVVADVDGDNDGVIDRLDRCPNTPAGSKVNANGCPAVLLTLTGINFAFDSSQIASGSENILDRAVTSMKEASTIRVRVTGHTDSRGSDAYNLKLSQRRADAVRDYLTANGIAANRLDTVGQGESQPVESNNTDDGRFKNRRVELHVDDSSTR